MKFYIVFLSFFFKETPNVYRIISSRQTCDAKVSSQEGNSPDDMLRSQSNDLVVKEVLEQRQPGDKLGSS